MATAKEVFDYVFSGLLGDEQKRLAARMRDDYGKDEESAGLTNKLLDHFEEQMKTEKAKK